MPSTRAASNAADFIGAYNKAAVGQRDVLADVRSGSPHNLIAGPSAMLWARESAHTKELFRACFLDTAEDAALDALVERQLGAVRRLDAAGQGTATLVRPSSGAGSGKIYRGTRIATYGGTPSNQPGAYRVASDVFVSAAALQIQVPIEATRTGKGVATTLSAAQLHIDDTIFDPTFYALSLVCADGTDRESDPEYLGRARKERRDSRPGYQKRIEDVCRAAGAVFVVALASNSLGDALDGGLNYVYVADAAFTTPPPLVMDCLLALDRARLLGGDLQVLPMTQQAISVAVTAHLWDDPGSFDLIEITSTIVAELVDTFTRRPKFWVFRQDELQGAVKKANGAVQSADVVTTPGEPAIDFPQILTRYVLSGAGITVQYTGPV